MMDLSEKNDFYYHYLNCIDGLSLRLRQYILFDDSLPGRLFVRTDKPGIKKLLQADGISEKALDYAAFRLSDITIKKIAEESFHFKDGIKFVSVKSKLYPEKLRHIYNPPFGLYIKGKLPDENRPVCAVIGARKCSTYGKKWTEFYTEYLCEHGVQIISGMARGIDGIAGRIAINYAGQSYAVLGSGPDVCYPEENRDLFNALWEKGNIITEYPPGVRAEKFRFPFRNRIIAGLSDAVFVAEAAEKSGSHITADFALEAGKDVFALPGPVDSQLSRGTNILIKNGAYPALDPSDILNSLKIF